MTTISYYNLTQATGDRMCYIRSTDIEQKNWRRLLWSVPDEMLYFISCGQDISIEDNCIKDKGKVERIFAPVLTDVLNWLYYGREPKHKALITHFNLCMAELKKDNMLNTKYKYWKRNTVANEKQGVYISGMTRRVDKERCM